MSECDSELIAVYLAEKMRRGISLKDGMNDSLKDEIRNSLDTLKDRERMVIKMYFGIERDYALTLNEIGEEFNLTRERVRQIKEKAIRRLRHRSRSKTLRNYLG